MPSGDERQETVHMAIEYQFEYYIIARLVVNVHIYQIQRRVNGPLARITSIHISLL